ncbi:MAG: outer membrane protein assembly factor BamE [Burkholderiales bacterium]|nr:outer membrane protein assembly factor BamE [Burkholderiales bacterium]
MNSPLLKSFAAAGLALALGACASITGGQTRATSYELEAIHAGLTQDEVRRIAGTPSNYTSSPRTGQTEWSYSFTDEWGYQSEFTVDFDASGIVAEALADRTH